MIGLRTSCLCVVYFPRVRVISTAGEDVPVQTLRKTAQRAGIGSVAVALLTAICYRAHIDLASAIPLYMLLVVVQSMTGDFRSAAIISVLSAACLDFFFTQPLFSLYMTNPLNMLALVAFVVTALVITRLVSLEREQANSSMLQKDRLDRLYKLSQQLLALEPEATMTEKFLEPFHNLFEVTAICAFDAEIAEVHTVGASRFELARKTREAYISGRDFSDTVSHLSARCLRFSGSAKMTGAIGFEGIRDPEETTGSLAALTAALMERTKAFRKATVAAAATQAEEYRSAVLDALAHEFKTPLATILAAAGGIREAGPLGPEQQDMAETVESEAVRLSSLTSRLLRTAHLDREEIQPRMELIDLEPLVAQLASQHSERSPDRRILFEHPHERVEVLADPQLLRIALSQLVENACRYSVPGSTVTIAIDRQGDSAAIKVSNTGSSIPYNERTRIFERFYRGVDATRTISGSGLGLYVARKVAIAHGGALDLEIQNGQSGNVTFCLRIPARKEAENRVVAAK
jgi:two-component system, OmpR family, sensor histidine kinase KdpD